ncbi:MAG: molybdopterin-dependent oxidoreductase [Bacteroidales bacterium]|nr:molybdopterin-dependent oxidoreductase [Bacteroidales bacterium]
MKKTSRRDFIKISALGAGGLALANPVLNWVPGFLPKEKTPVDESKAKRFPTFCEVCFWKCAGFTYLNEEGKIQKIIGNENDPHSNGRFCPRGTGGVGMYYDNDRLKYPLKRVVENGKSTFKQVSWDEALDFIAQKMSQIKKDHGPESMALLYHASSGSYFKHLLNAYGSKNYAKPSYAQCLGPREAGFVATYGSGVSSPEPTDVKNTKCLVLIGNHVGENMHNGYIQEVSDAIDRGASIITVDPRFSTVASKSKFWLPIKPATDLALLLAWIHVIIYEELYDKKYVEQYTFGFDQLKAHVKNNTPEWAYTKTDIRPEDIRNSAYEMAKAAPAVIIHPGRHTTWYGDDTQRSRGIAILNALLGSYGRKGGWYFPETKKVPSYPAPAYPHPHWTWKDITKPTYKGAGTGISNDLIKATLPSATHEHKIKGWLIVGTNLLTTIPDKELTLKAIQNLELMVVVDTMPMEITGYADIVLPECTYLERYDDIRSSQHRYPNIALRMPAAEPRWESKPGWWMARELGLRLGLEDYFKWKDVEEELDWKFKQMGTSLAEMQKIGVKMFDKEKDLYLQEGEERFFNTDSGKIELYSLDFEAKGYDPMPVYTEHKQPDPDFYRLIYGRAPMHTFGRTVNNPNLTDLMDVNSLWVNPKVAKIWGIEAGQEIWLKNQDGVISSFPIKVRVTERIRHDSVYMIHGFGKMDKRLKSYGKGIDDSELITNVKIDPIMGGTGMRENFVTFVLKNPHNEEVKA